RNDIDPDVEADGQKQHGADQFQVSLEAVFGLAVDGGGGFLQGPGKITGLFRGFENRGVGRAEQSFSMQAAPAISAMFHPVQNGIQFTTEIAMLVPLSEYVNDGRKRFLGQNGESQVLQQLGSIPGGNEPVNPARDEPALRR